MRMTCRYLFAYLVLLFLPVSAQALPTGNPDFDLLYFSGSGQCATCHNGLRDTDNNDVSIETAWSTSMMANSARDPYWRAKVASELFRNPLISEEINDACSRCHAPMANDTARKKNEPIQIFTLGEHLGFLDERNQDYFDLAMDGVSCTLCHQITDDGNLGTSLGHSGQFTIQDYLLTDQLRVDRPLFGQYVNPLTMPMRNQVEFTPVHATHISTSEMCATCHDLKTPFVDELGNLVPESPEQYFPEQMVYSEWNHSEFKEGGQMERSCQDCHMPRASGAVKISTIPANLQARDNFSQHGFHGANTVMMDILHRNKDELGVPPIDFSSAIENTRAFLQQAADVSLRSYLVKDGQLQLNLRVANHSGHKFPSGYPSRRAYLHVRVSDENGRVVFESGRMNTDGSIVGVDSDVDATRYEPHFDVIDKENDVQVYGPVMVDSKGKITNTLLRAAAYVKDNRLLPKGFDKTTAPADVAVHGQAAEDNDFVGGSDDIRYIADVGFADRLNVIVELRYQPLAFDHLQDLFQDSAELSQVALFQSLMEAPETFHDEVVSALQQEVINVDGCGGLDIELFDLTFNSEFLCETDASIVAMNVEIQDAGDVRFLSNKVLLGSGFAVRAGSRFVAATR